MKKLPERVTKMRLQNIYRGIAGLSIAITLPFLIGSMVGSVALTARALEHTEKDLVFRDFEQMKTMVTKIKQKDLHMDDVEESTRIKSKEAFTLILSRRDNDGSREKLMRMVQNDLEDDDCQEILGEIVDESLTALKQSETSLEERSAHFMILQNFMAETRPMATTKYKSTFEHIRDADIPVSDELIAFRRLKGTARAESPSTQAAAIVGKKI